MISSKRTCQITFKSLTSCYIFFYVIQDELTENEYSEPLLKKHYILKWELMELTMSLAETK